MLNTTAQPTTAQPEFDLKQTIGIGKLRGFWGLMTGFRGKYLVSTVSMGIAAIMNTVTFLLLAAFIAVSYTHLLWADRTDLPDSPEYARQLRHQAEQRTHG